MKFAFNAHIIELANTNNASQLVADVEILPNNTSTWQNLFIALFAEPDLQNVFRFMVKSILQKNKFLSPTLPNLQSKAAFVVPNHLAKIRLAYTTSPKTHSPEMLIMGGGSANAYTLDFYLSKKKFLNHQPQLKIVDESQVDFLYFLHSQDPAKQPITSLVLNYDLLYTDGSTHNFMGASLQIDSLLNTVCFPVGYWAVAAHEQDDKSIVSWSVQVLNQQLQPQSERRIYHLAPQQDLPAVLMLFRNSFNVFDTIRFDGHFSENYETESQTATDANAVFEFGIEGTKHLKINTGRLQRGWINYLQELMLSDEVYLVQNNTLIPLVKTSKSLSQIDTNKRDDTASIEFKYAKTEQYY